MVVLPIDGASPGRSLTVGFEENSVGISPRTVNRPARISLTVGKSRFRCAVGMERVGYGGKDAKFNNFSSPRSHPVAMKTNWSWCSNPDFCHFEMTAGWGRPSSFDFG